MNDDQTYVRICTVTSEGIPWMTLVSETKRARAEWRRIVREADERIMEIDRMSEADYNALPAWERAIFESGQAVLNLIQRAFSDIEEEPAVVVEMQSL